MGKNLKSRQYRICYALKYFSRLGCKGSIVAFFIQSKLILCKKGQSLLILWNIIANIFLATLLKSGLVPISLSLNWGLHDGTAARMAYILPFGHPSFLFIQLMHSTHLFDRLVAPEPCKFDYSLILWLGHHCCDLREQCFATTQLFTCYLT